MLFCYLEKYIIRYTRDVSYEMFESECLTLFKFGLFFIVEIFGCFILTQMYCVITKTYIAISWGGHSIATSSYRQFLWLFFRRNKRFLTRNKRLSVQQSGNKKQHSTETLNLLITDHLLDAMDNKKLSAVILIDTPLKSL